jgi:hypothetical protein
MRAQDVLDLAERTFAAGVEAAIDQAHSTL